MSEPHLAAGSRQPALVPGKLRLYSMEYCPYAQRARLVLKAKNIPHDVVNINLSSKPDWYLKIHPEGKVPVIDTGAQIISESLDIADFLDENYPENPLYPKDPESKKRDQELIKKIAPLTIVFHKCLLGKKEKSLEDWAKDFAPLLQEFESELAKRGAFFGGAKPGMVDYMLWPWGERSPLVPLRHGQQRPLFGDDKFPLLKKWWKSMRADPTAQASYNGPEKYFEFMQARLNNRL